MDEPGLSIVVCTYNRMKFILNCMQSLSIQTLNKGSFEVILVDNNSTDGSAAIIKEFISSHQQLPFRYVLEPRHGLAIARNRGINEARYDIITFIDDDAETIPEFAKTIYDFMLAHPEAAGAGGRILPRYSETGEPEWMSRYLAGFLGTTDYGQPARKYKGKMKYPAGCNMTYRKGLLLKAGGFNNQLTFRSDDKQIYRAVKSINDIVYFLPGALLYHNIDASRLEFANFKKLYIETGRGEQIRVMGAGKAVLAAKIMEYIIKFGSSILIWLLFILKGKGIKGRYVFYSQWFTLKGVFIKNVITK